MYSSIVQTGFSSWPNRAEEGDLTSTRVLDPSGEAMKNRDGA